MKGAVVFIVAFFLFLVITLGYQDLPPGGMIYDAATLPRTTEPVLGGLPTTTLIISIFNGVIYGVIIWLIYTIVNRLLERRRG